MYGLVDINWVTHTLTSGTLGGHTYLKKYKVAVQESGSVHLPSPRYVDDEIILQSRWAELVSAWM